MTVTIYALKSCDSCKKAIKALTAAGHELKIIDVRADGVPEDQLAAWLATTSVRPSSTVWWSSAWKTSTASLMSFSIKQVSHAGGGFEHLNVIVDSSSSPERKGKT